MKTKNQFQFELEIKKLITPTKGSKLRLSRIISRKAQLGATSAIFKRSFIIYILYYLRLDNRSNSGEENGKKKIKLSQKTFPLLSILPTIRARKCFHRRAFTHLNRIIKITYKI